MRTANLSAKAALILLLLLALLFPDASLMRDKAAGLRAVLYPMLRSRSQQSGCCSWKERASFPWLADFLITVTCFTDILGNRMNLYDTLVWFDDWMRFMNTGLLAAAAILLTMHHSSTFLSVLERALAVGATGANGMGDRGVLRLHQRLFRAPLRLRRHLDDLLLGTLGAITAAATVHTLWVQGKLTSAAPQLELRAPGESAARDGQP